MSVKILKTVLLISLPILLFSCGEEEEVKQEVVRPIKVLKVSSGGSGEFSFPGVVDAGKKVVLSFRVNGRVMALPVMEGDNVSKGQLLARLDPKDFELNVTQAKAQFVKAHADYERYQTLYEKDAVPIADLDLKKAQKDVAKTQLDEAEKNLAYTYLRAPFSGVIGNRFVENFTDVRAQESIIDLNNVKNVEVIINVSENFIRGINAGMKAEAYAIFENAPNVKFPLSRKEVSNRADPVTQTFRVTLQMPQPENFSLLPGMTCEVFVTIQYTGENQIEVGTSVPAIAVLSDPDGSNFVWVIDESTMTAEKRKVSIGELKGSEDINITSGLNGGEIIAIAGTKNLEEGTKVRFWEEQEEGK